MNSYLPLTDEELPERNLSAVILTSLDIPEFHRTIVGGCDHKMAVELKAGDRRLMLVRTGESLKAVTADNVPHFNGRIGIARH